MITLKSYSTYLCFEILSKPSALVYSKTRILKIMTLKRSYAEIDICALRFYLSHQHMIKRNYSFNAIFLVWSLNSFFFILAVMPGLIRKLTIKRGQ